MARYKNGINGPLSGSVGTVIAASWRGINYLKGKHDPSDKLPSAAQLRQRKVMALVSGFLRPLKLQIAVGYQDVTEGKTPMNEAISFVMREAVVSDGEDLRIDFTKLVFSRGALLISIVREMTLLAEAVLELKWEDVLPSAFCRVDDLATFIVYHPGREQFVAYEGIASRGDSAAYLAIPQSFAGGVVHVYMHYVNAKGDGVSTGQYLGACDLRCVSV